MDMSSAGSKSRLICLTCISGFLLILMCAAVALIALQPASASPDPGTGSSFPSSLSRPATLPGTSGSSLLGSSTTMIPGTSTLPTMPSFPTAPVVPATSVAPTVPTTVPTAPTTIPTTVPTAPTTIPTFPPTIPTTVPTVPATEPTQPPIPFDEAAFFAESVFLGDSVTNGLYTYCIRNKGALHGAKFLCAASYAVRHAVGEVGGQNVVSITYQGEKMRPEDALAAMGAKRVFIMLGLNDITFGLNRALKNWDLLIQNIRAKCPDIEIYIQSGTPIWIPKEKDGLTNENMDKYNVLLEQYCQDNGCYFVNVAPIFKNEQGGLKAEFCLDYYVHLNNAGVEAWIAYLKAYAAGLHQ